MKNTLVLLMLLCVAHLTQAQFFKSDDAKNVVSMRGSVAPIDPTYANYRSYSMKISLDKGFEESFKAKKMAYSEAIFNERLGVWGLKKKDDGDFTITYTLARYELITNESYLENSYQNAPAYYIGLESNLTIQDKQGKLIYKRYNTPKVKMYVIDVKETYDNLAYKIVLTDFIQLFNEFESYYLYSPVHSLRFFDVKKRKKSKSTFNEEEFNQSTQVLPALLDVERSNWSSLLGEAQKYWKGLVDFKDDDEDLQQDIRFNANYNLAVAALFLGNLDEFDKYMPGVKENEKSFLGMRVYYSDLEKAKKDVIAANNAKKDATKVESIAPEPFVYEYKKGPNAFRFAEFEKAEVTDDDNNKIAGKVRLLSDYPELVDYRTEKTRSNLGQLMDQVGSDKSSVWIFIEGEKKPKRTNLKKIVSLKDKDGKVYLTGKTGQTSNLVFSKNLVNTKRFALFDAIKSNDKIALMQEFFPQDSYAFKRPSEEGFFVAPEFIGRRKALKEYFADCPSVIAKIDKGEYDFNNKETYLKLYNDYIEASKK